MTRASGEQRRRSIRLRGYDYSQPGTYFVTICTRNSEYLFGDIVDGEMVLNEAGWIARRGWQDIPVHFPHVELDEWVIMPNHLHGIVTIRVDPVRRGTACRAPTAERFGKAVTGSIPTIIRSFKSAITKRMNELWNTPGAKVWQRNYWEHVVRNERELHRIREYIIDNPTKWESDRLYGPPSESSTMAWERASEYSKEEWMA